MNAETLHPEADSGLHYKCRVCCNQGRRALIVTHQIHGTAWLYSLKPAFAIPRCASGFFMKVSHTKEVRTFSAISMMIPVSIPTTSLSYHFFNGFKASTNP